MNERSFFNSSLYFTAIVTIGIWALLGWNYYHGGVPGHHIFHREELPVISNWWGGLLLPLLTCFLLYRIQKRLKRENAQRSKVSNRPANIVYRFAGGLLFGILLSVFFSFGYTNVPGYMLITLLLLALLFPIYPAECVLGFVIGMTFSFGVVLPTAVGIILAVTGALLYLYVRPAILYCTSGFMHLVSPDKRTGKR
jgi:hypothetical protein